MAILSALFTALSRKVGDFLQALLGWSIAALFGRLSSTSRGFVTLALLLSLLWPVFVVGVFYPAAATYLLAFVPIDDPLVRQVLRVVWLVLAVAAPVIVGLLVRAAAPLKVRKSVLAAIIGGYPLALGMAVSFLVTVVTVPALKLGSVVRRWTDEHVYVQPRDDRYRDVLGHLVTACQRAGLEPRVERVPTAMALSTKVLRSFSRGSIDTFLVKDPRRVCCEGLEVYLYPADLLIRGEPQVVARFRARLTQTLLERDAYIVHDGEAQERQDDLGRLWDELQRHEDPRDARAALKKRLRATLRELSESRSIPFEDWLTLDRIARRLGAELEGQRSIADEVPLEGKRSHEEVRAEGKRPHQEAENPSLRQVVTGVVHESRGLVETELELAKDEAGELVAAGGRSAMAFGAAVACLGAGLSLLGVALVTALGGELLTALLVGGGFFVSAAIVGLLGYVGLPKDLMKKTRKRLHHDWKLIAERAS